MTRTERINGLAELFQGTGKAHHQAFIATDGEDANWAIWYGQYLEDRLEPKLGVRKAAQDLVVAFIDAAEEHQTRGGDTPWPDYYARLFTERFVPEADEVLALYYFPSCPYCRRVLAAIERLGVDVELRDIWDGTQHRNDLTEARGRTTVPVLRCTAGEKDRWMPESRDIIAHLQARFA
jgi:glutaredoxin